MYNQMKKIRGKILKKEGKLSLYSEMDIVLLSNGQIGNVEQDPTFE